MTRTALSLLSFHHLLSEINAISQVQQIKQMYTVVNVSAMKIAKSFSVKSFHEIEMNKTKKRKI